MKILHNKLFVLLSTILAIMCVSILTVSPASAIVNVEDAVDAGAGIDESTCTLHVELDHGEVKQLAPGGTVTDKDDKDITPAEGGTLATTHELSSTDYGTLCTFSLIKQIITWVTYGAGIIALVMLILAGILYALGRDEEEKTKKAKGVAIAAVVGFAIVLLSQGILALVRSVI